MRSGHPPGHHKAIPRTIRNKCLDCPWRPDGWDPTFLRIISVPQSRRYFLPCRPIRSRRAHGQDEGRGHQWPTVDASTTMDSHVAARGQCSNDDGERVLQCFHGPRQAARDRHIDGRDARRVVKPLRCMEVITPTVHVAVIVILPNRVRVDLNPI